MPDLARSILSDANRSNRGKSLETLILASQSRTTVLLTKMPTGSRKIRTPRGLVNVQIPSTCDFFGMFAGTGRMIVFDAKQSANPNRLSTSVDHFSELQRQELLRYGVAAVAGLLCERTSHGELFWCDWRLLTTRRPSIEWGEMWPIGRSTFTVNWMRIAMVEEQIARKA